MLALLLAIYLGSGRLARFDVALIAYTSATVLACFGLVYRYSVWLEKPSTRIYWRRGWTLFARPERLLGNVVRLVVLLWRNVVAQFFIERRSFSRWAAPVTAIPAPATSSTRRSTDPCPSASTSTAAPPAVHSRKSARAVAASPR